MRCTMSSATLTTISSPVPPRNAEICGGMCSQALIGSRDHRDDAAGTRADVGHRIMTFSR
jgi:hypothetical protein